MTTYYVRKTGSDAAAGTSPAAAWQTLNHAAGQVVAGDTVYVGAGVYREAWDLSASGASGSEIVWRGDLTGEYTGDAGLVYVTVLSGEAGGTGTGHTLNLTGITFNQFYRIIIGPCGTDTADRSLYAGGSGSSFEGVYFEDCVFQRGPESANCVDLNYVGGASFTSERLWFNRCYFAGGVRIANDSTWSAATACAPRFHSCIFDSTFGVTSNITPFQYVGTSGQTYGPSGFEFLGCTFVGGTYAMANSYELAAQTMTVKGCLWVMGSRYGLPSTDFSLTEEYNVGTGQYMVYVYSGDATDTRQANLLFGMWLEPLARHWWGFNPWLPWEPVVIADGFTSAPAGNGHPTLGIDTDFYGRPRDLGGRWVTAGAVAARPLPAKDTAVVRDSASSLRLDGSGCWDIRIPVDAVETTIDIYVRRNSSYTGSYPEIQVLHIPGVSDQSDAQTGAADQWEKLSVTFTPTQSGIITLRLHSRDTSASGGSTYFADLAVTNSADPGAMGTWLFTGDPADVGPSSDDPLLGYFNGPAPLPVYGYYVHTEGGETVFMPVTAPGWGRW